MSVDDKKPICCAFISSYFGPYYSNYVASLLALEKKLQKENISSVYVFPKEVEAFKWISALKELTEKVYFIDFKPNSLQNVITLRRIIKKEHVTLIYSRMCGWDFTAHFAAPTIPIVWHMDLGVNTSDKLKRIKNWIKFHVLAFGKTYHVGVSDAVTEAINFYGPKHRCISIVNGIDFSRLREKSKYCFHQPIRLLLFGWAPRVKGLDTALEACAALNSQSTEYELWVSAQDKTYQYIEDYYKEADKPSWLILLPPSDNVSELYLQTDIMISASRSESFSYCLAEAIYSGLPVVFSDISGTRWASAFENATVFAAGDPQDLRRALTEVSGTSMTSEAHQRNVESMRLNYSIESWVKKELQFIRSL